MSKLKINVHKIICFVLSIILLCCSTSPTFATVNSKNDVTTKESFTLDGELYTLERQIYCDKVVSTVYNCSNEIESSFTYDRLSGNLDGYVIENSNITDFSNILDIQGIMHPYSTPNYKLVSTTTGSLKPAAWTTAAVIAAIASLMPGAGAVAISTLAVAIISDAGSSYTYKMETWTASDATYFYQKTVFKVYSKDTGKKVGSDIITKTKTRQK